MANFSSLKKIHILTLAIKIFFIKINIIKHLYGDNLKAYKCIYNCFSPIIKMNSGIFQLGTIWLLIAFFTLLIIKMNNWTQQSEF